jgi:hypothetical protein
MEGTGRFHCAEQLKSPWVTIFMRGGGGRGGQDAAAVGREHRTVDRARVAAQNHALTLSETSAVKGVPRLVDERSRALRVVRRR